jgi:hypothetical protein
MTITTETLEDACVLPLAIVYAWEKGTNYVLIGFLRWGLRFSWKRNEKEQS